MLRDVDVAVPRSTITQYALAPVEPTLTAAETAAISSWGIDANAFAPIKVLAPRMDEHIKVPIEFSDVRETLNGGYLNGFIIDAFMGSIMPDFVTATQAASRGEMISDFYLPTYLSTPLLTETNSFEHIKPSLIQAFGVADSIHMPLHYKETHTHCEHWVHMRVKKSVRKVEIFESAGLVTSTLVGWRLLDALVQAGALASHDAWSVVLYNRSRHKMPRQGDGSSCGVFVCVVALHLVAKQRLPRNIQNDITAWRRYVAVKVWASRL